MEKSCNIREVARKAGVSPGTVSRVLNNRMGNMQVSDATRKLIFQCAKELDYQPNVNARRLFSKRSGILGLVVPSFLEIHANVFEDRHIINLINGIEQALSVRKYKLMILFKDKEFIDSGEYLSLFRSKQLDGLLIWGAYRHESFWNELDEKKYPHVFITTYPDEVPDKKNIFTADYTVAGYDIMHYLLKKDYGCILWAKPQDDSSVYDGLKTGIEKAIGKNKKQVKFDEMPCDYSLMSGYELMGKLHKDGFDYSVILFTSREAASGAMDYCSKHGIRVPEDIAIAACDSASQHAAANRITTSAVDDILLGTNAVEGLIASIENRPCSVLNRIKTVFLPGDTA